MKCVTTCTLILQDFNKKNWYKIHTLLSHYIKLYFSHELLSVSSTALWGRVFSKWCLWINHFLAFPWPGLPKVNAVPTNLSDQINKFGHCWDTAQNPQSVLKHGMNSEGKCSEVHCVRVRQLTLEWGNTSTVSLQKYLFVWENTQVTHTCSRITFLSENENQQVPPLLLNLDLWRINPKIDFVNQDTLWLNVWGVNENSWCTMHWKEQREKAQTEEVKVKSLMMVKVHCSCSDLLWAAHNQTLCTTWGCTGCHQGHHLAHNYYSGRQFTVAEP